MNFLKYFFPSLWAAAAANNPPQQQQKQEQQPAHEVVTTETTFRHFPLFELPVELVLHIFTYLDVKGINSLSQACTVSHSICKENRLWKKVARRIWHVKCKSQSINWRHYHSLKYYFQNFGSIEWQTIPPNGGPRPSRRYQHTATTVGTKIYLIGGQESTNVRFDDIYEFDTETYNFSSVTVEGASHPPHVARHIAVAVDDKIYVHGGYDGHGAYHDLSVFDAAARTWTYVQASGDVPSRITNAAAAVVGRSIYMFGGVVKDGTGQLVDINDMYVLDIDTFVWRRETCVDTPSPRCGHRMVALRGLIYLYGGGAGPGFVDMFTDMYIYDPVSKVWTKLAVNESPEQSSYPCMFTFDPFIFIFGGQIKYTPRFSSAVYCFDTLTHTWHAITPAAPSLPEPRDMAALSVCGQNTFLFGGCNRRGLEDVFFLHFTRPVSMLLKTCNKVANE